MRFIPICIITLRKYYISNIKNSILCFSDQIISEVRASCRNIGTLDVCTRTIVALTQSLELNVTS